jgi:CheY-like chemotaxis protein
MTTPHLPNRPILLVEDEETDVQLFLQALEQAGAKTEVKVVRTTQEALDYLKRDGPFADRRSFPLPRLVVLDLKLPDVSGFEVLRQIRADPALHGLRVAVLSGTLDQSDATKAYRLGANSFIVKPLGFTQLVEICRTLHADSAADERAKLRRAA